VHELYKNSNCVYPNCSQNNTTIASSTQYRSPKTLSIYFSHFTHAHTCTQTPTLTLSRTPITFSILISTPKIDASDICSTEIMHQLHNKFPYTRTMQGGHRTVSSYNPFPLFSLTGYRPPRPHELCSLNYTIKHKPDRTVNY